MLCAWEFYCAWLYFVWYWKLSHTPKYSHMQQFVQLCISWFWSFFIGIRMNGVSKSWNRTSPNPQKFTKQLKYYFFISSSYETLFLSSHVLLLWAGSCNTRGHHVLAKVTKEEVFGFRMSKSSPCWWFKRQFVCRYWKLFWVLQDGIPWLLILDLISGKEQQPSDY